MYKFDSLLRAKLGRPVRASDLLKSYNFAIVLDLGSKFHIIHFGDLVCLPIEDDSSCRQSRSDFVKHHLFNNISSSVSTSRLDLYRWRGLPATRSPDKHYSECIKKDDGLEGILIASRNLFHKHREVDFFTREALKTYCLSGKGEVRDQNFIANALEQADPYYEQNLVLISKVRDRDSGTSGGFRPGAEPRLPDPSLSPA